MSEAPLWNLPAGWCWTEAGQLIDDILAGKSFKCNERPPQQGEVGVVKVSAVTWGSYDEQESKTCTSAGLVNPGLFVRPGDFLFSRANTIELVGACVIADRVTRDVMLSDKILRFSVRDGWKKWLLWSLRSSHGRAEIERLATGNQDSMRNIGQSRVCSIRIPIPADGEQQRIVEAIESYFTRLDDAVATLERVERNLKRYRASVLKSAVEGRLVPTEVALAKQEGRNYEPASVLLERILNERRRRWFESGNKGKYQEPEAPDTTNLPELPEGWCWATVDQLITESLANGRSVPTAVQGFPVLRLTTLKAGAIDLTERKIGAWTREEAEPYLVKQGDFLVARGNGSIRLVGRGGLLRQSPDEVAYPDTLIRIRLSSACLPELFGQLWDSRWVRDQIEKKAKTTAGIYKVNQTDLGECVIPLMPRSEQHRLLEEIERQTSVIIANAKGVAIALNRAARLRQSVLKWAFEGKLADQDPNDEPASVLLERIKAKRETANPTKPARLQRDDGKKKQRA